MMTILILVDLTINHYSYNHSYIPLQLELVVEYLQELVGEVAEGLPHYGVVNRRDFRTLSGQQ